VIKKICRKYELQKWFNTIDGRLL